MISQNIDKIPILELRHLGLQVGDNAILKNLNLRLVEGSIHTIVGDHGSGKSLVARIISGDLTPTEGMICLQGKTYNSLSLLKARRLGIETVYQDIALIDDFTVAENLFMPDRMLVPLPYFKKRLLEEARDNLSQYGYSIPEAEMVRDLHLSSRIAVSILRALMRKPRLLVLDESLEKMTGEDRRRAVSILRDACRDTGMSVLSLSHAIDGIYEYADTVTIIKNGSFFLTDKADNIDRINLIKLCYTQMHKNDGSGGASEEFYQLLKYNEAILQELPVNLVVLDDKSRIKLINNSGRRFFGVDAGSFRGQEVLHLFPEGNDQGCAILLKALPELTERTFYNVPFLIGGESLTTNLRTLPIFDGAFRIGTIVIIEDVTEQESLREHVSLSEKLASVGLLAAGVAHEINNPLEMVYNHLNYMRLAPERSEIEKTIDELEDEMTYIKQIVSNLISFSDQSRDYREEFSVNQLIRDLLNLIRFNADHEKIVIKFEEARDDPTLTANRNEIKQVMLNLLKNSFEAMPDGGRVALETEVDEKGDERFVVIRVADTGQGMGTVKQGDIFLPFYSTKGGSEGNLGLGLSVSYGIVKKYGGTIVARDRSEGGCVFTLTFPV